MRYFRLTIIFAMLLSFFISLWLGPRKVDAGACNAMGLSNKCVKTGDIASQAVTTSKIKKNAVRTSRIKAGAVTRSRLADSVAGLNGNGMVKAWARMKSDGTLASCWRCNTNTSETRKVNTGRYEVDFTPLSTDIRGRPRMAILDSFEALYFVSGGGIRIGNLPGDPSSVYVNTYDNDGNNLDLNFTLIIF